ncbi:Integrator complex subunit 6-B [Geodia barretti]|uniref:Integrator complex subunit 6-B n=1 Tax=Geodia barretti TaxID=519541 RepID=A0AA35W747_GEOBA|nr:Integrator complex subunit 6-B [Geodia barretti]
MPHSTRNFFIMSYIQPLRNSLRLMGGPPNLVPDMFELQLSFSITNYLHKLKKQAKMESERVVSAISQNRTNDAHKRSNGIVDLGDGISIAIGSTQEGERVQGFRNPFDIVRSSLLEQVRSMRTNFLQVSSSTALNVIEEVARHQVPISQMGNYQEHLKKLNPLREVDSGAVRTQLFGNPFKLEKKGSGQDLEISLADEHMVETLGSRRSSGRRRNPRSPSPVPSPRSPSLPSSPIPSPTPSLTNHNKHSVHKNWSLPEEEPNGSRKLPTKDAKTPKVEPGKEGVNHPNAESMESGAGSKGQTNGSE